MPLTPEQLEQLTPLGLMALALSYMAKLGLEEFKNRKKEDPNKPTLKALAEIRKSIYRGESRLEKIEDTLTQLSEVHKDPKSPFATGEVLEKQEVMGTDVALIKQTVENIERRLP